MENESCIKDIISSSLNQVRTIVDADTVIGKQIVTPSGVVIIPVSKVSMGFATGGVDIPNKSELTNNKGFGGGGGTGVTVAPIGFLTVTPEGEVSLIPMTSDKPTTIEQIGDLINSAPDLISRIKDIFFPGSAKDKDDDADELAALEEAYRQKLAQEAIDDTEQTIDDAEKILDADEELSKEDKKRLKREAKELKRLEKLAKKHGRYTIDSADRVFPESDKRGKISDKTLESGRL